MTVFLCERMLRSADAEIEPNMAVTVEAGRILSVAAIAEQDRARLDAISLSGLTMPGLIDAHTHLRSTPAIEQSKLPGLEFAQWTVALNGMTPVPQRLDAEVAAVEALRAGVTGVQVILHSFGDRQQRLGELSDAIAALEQAGIRGLIVIGFTDQAEYARPGADIGFAPHRGMSVEEWPGFLDQARALVAAARDTISLAIGPVAPQWCSDQALEVLAAARGELRVHTHLHESDTHREWLGDGEAPLARLHRHGLLGSFASVAHGVHLRSDELALLAELGVTIVHCPNSNECLGVGQATVSRWLAAGVQPALGMDSQAIPQADMFAEMRAALEISRLCDASLEPVNVLQFATLGGAAATGAPSGEIAPGKFADLVVLASSASTVAELVSESDPGDVHAVYVGGVARWPLSAQQLEAADARTVELQQIVSLDSAQRQSRIDALLSNFALEPNGGAR